MQGTGVDRRKRLILLIVALVVLTVIVVLDQFTKKYFKSYVAQNGDVTIIDGFFYITYVVNTGAAWSFLSNVSWGQILFQILTPIALVIFCLFYVYAFKKNYIWLQVSVVFVVSGTIGNYIDRLIMGGVSDFISLVFGSYKFPIFNIADCFLVIGVIMIFIHYLFIDNNALFRKKHATKNVCNKRKK